MIRRICDSVTNTTTHRAMPSTVPPTGPAGSPSVPEEATSMASARVHEAEDTTSVSATASHDNQLDCKSLSHTSMGHLL